MSKITNNGFFYAHTSGTDYHDCRDLSVNRKRIYPY